MAEHLSEVTRKQVAVAGYGQEGVATAAWLKTQAAEVTVLDENASLKVPAEFKTKLGRSWLEGIGDYDLVIRSPGILPDKLVGARDLTTATNLFFEYCPAVIIGITGTNGKGTTATLLHQLLGSIGRTSHLLGNVGVPALDHLSEIKAEEVVVMELSSFQLMDIRYSPHIAVLLSVSTDHMNWHKNQAEYVAAKAMITAYQSEKDLLIVHPTDPAAQKIAQDSKAVLKPYMQPPQAYVDAGAVMFRGQELIKVKEVGLIGAHNLENICAALTALDTYIGADVAIDQAPIRKILQEFRGLPDRLEFVREVGGIRYYNDSQSTTPPPAIAAIRSFDQPIILIVGGQDKGIDYSEITKAIVVAKVKHVFLIGEIAPLLEQQLRQKGYTRFTRVPGLLDEVLVAVRKVAETGDVVLLSPGTSSYDQYQSSKARGEMFRQLVREI